MNILVAGAGWAGEKHIANLVGLKEGNTITVSDKDNERLRQLQNKYSINITNYKVEEILSSPYARIDAVFICLPTYLHIDVALKAAQYGAHIFMEKPLSHDLEGVDELLRMVKEKNLVLYVNYNMKFQPSLNKIKGLLESGAIGRIIYYHAECGQHLNIGSGIDWLGDKEKGGGVLLETSHEIDYTRWLVGEISEVAAFVSTISLPITSDDCADLILRFKAGAQGHIHVDFLQPFYRRKILITGERGVIEWDYKSHPSWEETYQEVRVRLLGKPDQLEEVYTYRKSKSKDDIFKQAMEHFFRCIEGKEFPWTTGENAIETLKVVLAAKISSCQREFVETKFIF